MTLPPYRVRPPANILATDDGRPVGFRQADGEENMFATISDDQTMLVRPDGSQMPGTVDPSGRVVLSNGRRSAPIAGQDTLGGELIFWPFRERTGAKVIDLSGAVEGQYAGASGTRWAPWDGANFGNANNTLPITNGTAGGFTSGIMSACDLSTLSSRGDMLHVFGVIGHPTTFSADAVILGWGCSADSLGKGGWALGIDDTTTKFYFAHCPVGGTLQQTNMNMDGVRGPNTDNYCTAFCLEIMTSVQSGYFEVRLNALPLTTNDEAFTPRSMLRIASLPSGTRIVGADTTAPLTIGCWPTTNGTTFSNKLTGCGLLSLGIHRRPIDPGAAMRVVRDLRDSPKTLPGATRY